MSEAQQVIINTLEQSSIQTKWGEKQKYTINGKWGSFIGSWNKDWAVGSTAKGIFTQKESNGTVYYNIECPPELKTDYGKGSKSSNNDGTGINTNEVVTILRDINSVLHTVFSKELIQRSTELAEHETAEPMPTTDTDPDPTPVDSSDDGSDINVEDIPY